jgi:hypothetical protein
MRLYHRAVTQPQPPASRWFAEFERWNRKHSWTSDALIALAFAVVLGALSISGSQGLQTAYGLACVAMLTILLARHEAAWPKMRYPERVVALEGRRK